MTVLLIIIILLTLLILSIFLQHYIYVIFKPQYKNKIMIGLIKKVIIALLFQKI